MLEFIDVEFSYGKRKILDGISFRAENGRVTALLGMNGQGKTTVLRLAGGVISPSNGQVLADGKDMSLLSRKAKAQRVSLVPQQPVFGGETVFDSVLSGRTPFYSFSPSDNDVDIAALMVQKLGLEEIAFRSTDMLSGGEKQMTAIARAFAGQTANLLLDEPTNNLDIKNQIEVMETIRKTASKENKAVLMTMHDIWLALKTADDVVLIRNGKIIFCGKTEDVTEEEIFMTYGVRVRLDKDVIQTFVGEETDDEK